MREVVLTAKRIESLEDELEARIALAGMLVSRGDPAGRDEARHHLQITRDKALEGHLEPMYLAALIGQAGLMAQSGQIQGALDRCLEVARLAVAQPDLRCWLDALTPVDFPELASPPCPETRQAMDQARLDAFCHAALRSRWVAFGMALGLAPNLFAQTEDAPAARLARLTKRFDRSPWIILGRALALVPRNLDR